MEIGFYNSVNVNDGNIIRLVEMIFSMAFQLKASDIHIEVVGECCRVRLRIDGLLQELCSLPLIRHNSILSRIKLISEMDISEKRQPQDGHLAVSYAGRDIDLRIASLPTVNGEKLAIRILDKNTNIMQLDALGFSYTQLLLYKQLIHAPHGMVLVTGPTGSGKSTTLYATLMELNDISTNIVTLEDPIEYKLEGINQILLNKKIGLNFASALRAVVRQDPDIIMLGEIRDEETARIAIQAALTGHLVFSTLHTNSALGAIDRLLDLGIEPFLIAAALRGVIAQRLVRKICPKCKQDYSPTKVETTYISRLQNRNTKLKKGMGCSECRNTGYQGRLAIHELLLMDEKLARFITNKTLSQERKNYLQTIGFRTLQEDGIYTVNEGLTTVDELIRAGLI